MGAAASQKIWFEQEADHQQAAARTIVTHPCAGEEDCCLRLLLPHLKDLHVEAVEDLGDRVKITARTRIAESSCSACGTVSSRGHSWSVRQLEDETIGGRPVVIALRLRRHFCVNPMCDAVTFTEQVA